MALGLAFLWFDSGGRLRVRAGSRGPWVQTTQPEAYDRYASVDETGLLWLAYPDGGGQGSRRRLQDAKKALDVLERIGYAKRTGGDGIMPGPRWAGWGGSERDNRSRFAS